VSRDGLAHDVAARAVQERRWHQIGKLVSDDVAAKAAGERRWLRVANPMPDDVAARAVGEECVRLWLRREEPRPCACSGVAEHHDLLSMLETTSIRYETMMSHLPKS
jgi:hypothetical protein